MIEDKVSNPIDIIDELKEARMRIRPCVPPLWANTGHLQTILGHLLPSDPLSEKGESLNITLESEDERIVSTYLRGESRTVVYLFHGLGGTSEATYMQRTAAIARSFGHHVFLNNHRGCGAGVGLAVEPYHSGRAEDLSTVIAYGRRMLPGHKHIAIGFSLSANALLLLAARQRATVLPDAAIAVNGPIDLNRASIQLTQGLNRIYDLTFVRELKESIRDREQSGKLKQSYSLRRVHTVRDFDQAYTALAGGFRDRDDYYNTCSAKQYLPRIEIPTVLLTAKDDPFVDANGYLSADLSRTTVLHIERFGGHMGYLSSQDADGNGSAFGYHRWLDGALREYLRVLDHAAAVNL